MMTKYLRLTMLVGGVLLAMGSMAACSDDSTASAPITSNPVTTTSLYSMSASVSASDAATSSAGPSSADPPTPSAGGTSLPATAPQVTTPPAGGFSAPDGQPLSDKAKRYLQALRAQNVTFLGDSDNSVALTLGAYVCEAQRKNTDPATVKGYVTALVAAGTQSAQEANSKADKVIKAAKDNYC